MLWRLSLLLAAAALWTTSLFLPALNPTDFNGDPRADEWWPGYGVLLMGWTALLFGVPGWLANTLWLPALALGFAPVRLWSAVLAVAGLALGATALLGVEFPDPNGGPHEVALGVGYWVWMATPLPILAAACIPEARPAVEATVEA